MRTGAFVEYAKSKDSNQPAKPSQSYLELCMASFMFLIDDTSTIVGHFVSSIRESEKRDRRDRSSRRD